MKIRWLEESAGLLREKASSRDAIKINQQMIDSYNRLRPHLSLNMQTQTKIRLLDVTGNILKRQPFSGRFKSFS